MPYLLDSNTVIDYLAGKMPASAMNAMHAIVNQSFYISVITHIETLGFESGNAIVDSNTLAFVQLGVMFDLTEDVIKQTILLRKKRKMLKMPDAIIAATAITHGFTLLTRNTSDFANITGLTVVDPHTL